MDYLIAVLVFPALVAVLAIGAGLLIDRALQGTLPGVLVPPVGLAVLVVVAELAAYAHVLSVLAPVALALVGVAGLVVGFPRLRGARLDPWPIAASLAVYLMVCAPVILAGRPTMAGYLLDTTVAFHLTGADYLLEHGRDFTRLPDSSLRRTLEGYFGTQYPSGGQTLLGGAGRLVATERIWLYAPFMALLLAFCTPTLYHLARSAKLPRALAAAAAALASAPALVYSYAQMGAIKEMSVLPFVLLLGSVLVLAGRLFEKGWRGALLVAVVGAAGFGAIGVAFAPWLGIALLAGLVLLLLEARDRVRAPLSLLAWAALLAVALVVLALPTFGPLTESIRLAQSLSTANVPLAADPGNLLRPLLPQQMLGVWLGGTHRVDPLGHFGLTYALIGIAAVAALLGAIFLVRRRLWSLVAFMATLGVVWLLLTRRGTTWTDAKLLVITSPAVILLAAVGIESLRRSGRRIEAALVGGLIALGILASNAFQYHDTNLAPTERYRELVKVGERFAGLTPTLTPEFDEFAMYALQEMAPDGPGNALRSEKIPGVGYGLSVDVDDLPYEAVRQYRAIVVRRRPDASRPPSGFELAFRGDFYDVWRRTDAGAVLAHRPAGEGGLATGRVPCSAVRSLARQAQKTGGKLAYVARPAPIELSTSRLFRVGRPPGWVENPAGVLLATPGNMTAPFEVFAGGTYRVWLEGDFSRAVKVSVDGKAIGEVAYESGNAGNYASPLEVELSSGTHRIRLERGGGGLGPGDGSASRLVSIAFELQGAAPSVQTLAPADWRELCGRRLDWVAALRAT